MNFFCYYSQFDRMLRFFYLCVVHSFIHSFRWLCVAFAIVIDDGLALFCLDSLAYAYSRIYESVVLLRHQAFSFAKHRRQMVSTF